MSASATVPERTALQRMEALQRANDIRSRRAALKRDLKASRREVVEVLVTPPEWVETMKVFDLLMAAPKIGRVKASKALGRAKVSPTKTVSGLSDRQRDELLRILGAWG